MKNCIKGLGLFVAALALLLTPAVAAAAGESGPITFTIVAQQPGTGPYGYATTMAKFMNEALPEGSTVNVIPRGGSMANPTTLNMGKADVGISASCAAQWAWDGFEEVYGKHGKHRDIRYVTVGQMNVNFTFVIARKDYVEKTGNDTLEKALNAKDMPRIAMKPPGSVVPPIISGLFEVLGKSLEDYRKADKLIQVQPAQIGEMLKDGRVDLYFECTTLSHPTVTEICLTTDIVFLPISDEVVKKMNAFGMFPTTMKAGSYKHLDADYPTTATGGNIMAWSGADEEAVYLLTKALIERREQLVEENPQLRTWDPENDHDRTGIPIPLHPGAERYYREIGWIQ